MQRFFLTSLFVATTSLTSLAFAESPLDTAIAATAPLPASSIHSLIKKDTLVGTGLTARSGATVSMRYTGWLYDASAPEQHGKMFDSSEGRDPLEFVLGRGVVIRGWDQGVAGMKVGGKRTLIIPSFLAYGSTGAGDLIPPNAVLVFDVELMDVK